MKKLLFTIAFLSGVSALAQEIGIQLYSVRKEIPNDVKGTLALIKSWGITELEGGDTYGLSDGEFLKLCRDNGLNLVSIGADFNELKKNPKEIAERAQDLGVKYVVCYWLPHKGDVFTLADADTAIAVLNRAGRVMRDYDVNLCYHMHGYEFVPANITAQQFMEKRREAEKARQLEEEEKAMSRRKSEEGKMGKISDTKSAARLYSIEKKSSGSQTTQANEQSTGNGEQNAQVSKPNSGTISNPSAQLSSGIGTIFDYMVALLDKSAVNFEMDVYWVKQGGVDPASLLKKYPARFKLLHLKDRKIGTPNSTDGHADVETNVVLGTGDVNIAEVMRVAQEIGIEHYFIEDESSRVVKQVPQSVQYLKSLKK
jgi:sugar phosphate isomerase/epimerase